jgi:hypothetical protein
VNEKKYVIVLLYCCDRGYDGGIETNVQFVTDSTHKANRYLEGFGAVQNETVKNTYNIPSEKGCDRYFIWEQHEVV